MTTRPFLGTPVPGDGNRENALPLQVQTVSEEGKQAYVQASEPLKAARTKAQPGCLAGGLRALMTLVMFICLLGGVAMLFAGGFMALLEMGATAGLCYLVIKLLDRAQAKKEEKITGTAEYQLAESRMEQARNALDAELGIPRDCPVVDVLCFRYELSEGMVRIVDTREGLTGFNTVRLHAFSDEERLYLATRFEKYAFELSTLTGFRRVDTPVSIDDWNKGTSYTAEQYAPFGISSLEDEEGYKVGGYSVLTFEVEDTRWELYIPNYETAMFENLVRRNAQ